MDIKRNYLAIFISPIVGLIFLFIGFFIIQIIGNIFPKEMDDPMVGDGIYYFLFLILLIGVLIFQIIILEPIFRRYKRLNNLNKTSIKRICAIVIFSLSILFSLPMTIMSISSSVEFKFSGLITEFITALVILSIYFISNMITYYNIYVKRLD